MKKPTEEEVTRPRRQAALFVWCIIIGVAVVLVACLAL
jgi:hypothetical protein